MGGYWKNIVKIKALKFWSILLNSLICVWQKIKSYLFGITWCNWWRNCHLKWTIPLNMKTSLWSTLRIKKFPSLDKSLNHMHSKPKLEAVLIFTLLKKIKSKERNVSCRESASGQRVTCPASTLTMLYKGNLKIFSVEICCSLPVCRLCCVVLCNSLQFTECDKNFGSHFLLI